MNAVLREWKPTLAIGMRKETGVAGEPVLLKDNRTEMSSVCTEDGLKYRCFSLRFEDC